MEPQILGVTESKALDQSGKVANVLSVKWKVGTHGPFTELSTWQDLNNGTLLGIIRQKASTLATLPAVTA